MIREVGEASNLRINEIHYPHRHCGQWSKFASRRSSHGEVRHFRRVAVVINCFFAAIEGGRSRCQRMKARRLLLTLHNVHGGAGARPTTWRPTMQAETHETQVSDTVCRTGGLRRAPGDQVRERSIFKLALTMYDSCTMPCRQLDIGQRRLLEIGFWVIEVVTP